MRRLIYLILFFCAFSASHSESPLQKDIPDEEFVNKRADSITYCNWVYDKIIIFKDTVFFLNGHSISSYHKYPDSLLLPKCVIRHIVDDFYEFNTITDIDSILFSERRISYSESTSGQQRSIELSMPKNRRPLTIIFHTNAGELKTIADNQSLTQVSITLPENCTRIDSITIKQNLLSPFLVSNLNTSLSKTTFRLSEQTNIPYDHTLYITLPNVKESVLNYFYLKYTYGKITHDSILFNHDSYFNTDWYFPPP